MFESLRIGLILGYLESFLGSIISNTLCVAYGVAFLIPHTMNSHSQNFYYYFHSQHSLLYYSLLFLILIRGRTSKCSQGLLLALHSEVTHGGVHRQYRVPFTNLCWHVQGKHPTNVPSLCTFFFMLFTLTTTIL